MVNRERSYSPANEDQVEIHGGGVKVIRLHLTIMELGQARKTNNIPLIMHNLDRLYTEIEAYLKDDEIAAMADHYVKLNEMCEKIRKGSNIPDFKSSSTLFEIRLRRVMKRAELDSRLKEKEKYARSVL